MQRIPTALELSASELVSLRNIIANSFTPSAQIKRQDNTRLLALGLIHSAMGGLIATPTGRIVARR